jgi:hypothetical protein
MANKKPYFRILGSPEETGVIERYEGNIIHGIMLSGSHKGKKIQTKRSHILQYRWL